MSRTSTAQPRAQSDDEPDVLELAFALGQRMTGEVPIAPEDREPPEVDRSTSDEVEPSARQPSTSGTRRLESR